MLLLNFDYLLVYMSNLSSVYVVSIIFSSIAVFLTIYFVKFGGHTVKEQTPTANDKFIQSRKDDCWSTSDNDDDDDDGNEAGDNYSYVENTRDDEPTRLVGKLKTARLKVIENKLTAEQKAEEKEIEKEQLAAIFDLLKIQEEQFKLNSMGEQDFKAQLNLYR